MIWRYIANYNVAKQPKLIIIVSLQLDIAGRKPDSADRKSDSTNRNKLEQGKQEQ